MSPEQFDAHNKEVVCSMGGDNEMSASTQAWFEKASAHEYSYHFKWMGLPIIQFPQDILAIQELVWDIQPDLIIETGIARGGSLILYASLLELLGNDGKVIGIDIDIRPHNRKCIVEHKLAHRIELIEGSSVADDVVSQVYEAANDAKRVMVILDSNHTYEHALAELKCYSPLVDKGSYLIVLDTVIEDMPASFSKDRPWGPGDNPKVAVHEFLKTNKRFEIDASIPDKLQITVGPDGYLKCVESAANRKVA